MTDKTNNTKKDATPAHTTALSTAQRVERIERRKLCRRVVGTLSGIKGRAQRCLDFMDLGHEAAMIAGARVPGPGELADCRVLWTRAVMRLGEYAGDREVVLSLIEAETRLPPYWKGSPESLRAHVRQRAFESRLVTMTCWTDRELLGRVIVLCDVLIEFAGGVRGTHAWAESLRVTGWPTIEGAEELSWLVLHDLSQVRPAAFAWSGLTKTPSSKEPASPAAAPSHLLPQGGEGRGEGAGEDQAGEGVAA